MKADELKFHPFVSQCWEETQGDGSARARLKQAQATGDLTELEFYRYRVAHALAHLLSWMEQLQDAPTYLADFNYTGKARKSGITRARYLLYTVENYLIRLQALYDRCLQLTNRVFHICIEDSNVGHSVVVSNLQVSRTDIPALLKRVRKAVVEKQNDRNVIIHQSSYKEDDLDRLQLFYLYDRAAWEEMSKTSFDALSHIRSQLLRKVVAEKRREFQSINEGLFKAVNELLTALHVHYLSHAKKIATYA